MAGLAERPGGPPEEERDPDSEVTETAHDLARVLATLEDYEIEALRDRGTFVEWNEYGRFDVRVHDPKAPSCARDCLFRADFGHRTFDFGYVPSPRSPRGRFEAARELFSRKTEAERWSPSVPAPDRVTVELVDYFRTATGRGS